MSFTWKCLVFFLSFQFSVFAFDQTHAEFDSFLSDYVKVHEFHSEFDYKSALKDKSKLEKYTKSLSEVQKTILTTGTKNKNLAF